MQEKSKNLLPGLWQQASAFLIRSNENLIISPHVFGGTECGDYAVAHGCGYALR